MSYEEEPPGLFVPNYPHGLQARAVPEKPVPASYEKLLSELRSAAQRAGSPFILAEDSQRIGLSDVVGLSSGTKVHAALCELSGQGALWYSDHRQKAGSSGVRQVGVPPPYSIFCCLRLSPNYWFVSVSEQCLLSHATHRESLLC